MRSRVNVELVARIQRKKRRTVQATAVEEAERESDPSSPPPSVGKNFSGSAEEHHEIASQVDHGVKGVGSVKKKLFGVELSPDIIAIASVYFVQGILGLPRLAVTFFLKDELGLDPAETAFLSGIAAAPWLIKPLYGFLSDGLPLFGYRRRSYLVLCGLLGAASWASLSLFVHDKYAAVATILLSSLSVAVSDVVVDSMVVERARGESQETSGALQSLCWGSAAVGGILSAYFSGYLVQTYGTRFVFGVTSVLPLITSLVGALVEEEKIIELPAVARTHKPIPGTPSNSSPPSPSPSDEHGLAPVRADGGPAAGTGLVETMRVQLSYLWETVQQPTILLPTLFIFVWQATPQSDTALFFFTTTKLGFTPEFLGRVRLVASIASLAGVGIYNTFLKGVSLRKMFLWTTALGSALGMTQLLLVTGANRQLGISDEFFSAGDSLVLSVLGQVSFMPVLVLAARLCPPGVEATLFATLMSVSNGGGVAGGLLGGALTKGLGVTSTNFDNLALLISLCSASSLLTLPFLKFLPTGADIDAAVAEAQLGIDAMENKDTK